MTARLPSLFSALRIMPSLTIPFSLRGARKSLTEIWLGGDHYKWRAMRTNGVDERFCTGKATDWEKFEKWAETVPYTFRNPLSPI